MHFIVSSRQNAQYFPKTIEETSDCREFIFIFVRHFRYSTFFSNMFQSLQVKQEIIEVCRLNDEYSPLFTEVVRN